MIETVERERTMTERRVDAACQETGGYCGHCHTCGTLLHKVLDGEEWCSVCDAYRRYRSHGWAGEVAEA